MIKRRFSDDISLKSFYFLQLQLPFPAQWLHGQPSGHWQVPAIACLTKVDIFVKPTPSMTAPNSINEILNFFIGL